MSELSENLLTAAFFVGLFSASSLPMGSITSFVWRPGQRVIAGLMAFGAGSLLAALTIDLVAMAVHHGHFISLALGSILGGILFIILDSVVNNVGGYKRKISTTMIHRHTKDRQHFKATLEHLGRVGLFQEINDEDVDLLSQSLKSRFYAKGSVIFYQGDPAHELYIIHSGTVEMALPHEGNIKREVLSSGDAFGKSALFTGSPHGFTAQAIEDTMVSIIPKEALEQLLLVSKIYRDHVEEWLMGDEITTYLKESQQYDDRTITDWREELEESFDDHSILPDISDVERNSEDLPNIANMISRIDWLEELNDEETEALKDFLVYREYEKDSFLFHQEEPAQNIYIIHTGQVEMSDKTNKNRTHREGAGSGIGGRAFLCGLRHTMSARAVSKTTVWVLNRYRFAELLDQHPNFRLRVLHYLTEEPLQAYLQQKYDLNQGKILVWLDKSKKAVKRGMLLPSLLESGIESTESHGASLAIWLGILLDGIPESLVIGATMINNKISISLVAGLFLSNFPEALSSSRGMLEENFSRTRILIMWTSIMVFTGIGAVAGNIFMQEADPGMFAFIEGLAAGAMLTMIAQTMLPEAYSKGGGVTGLATLMGFLITISLKELEG